MSIIMRRRQAARAENRETRRRRRECVRKPTLCALSLPEDVLTDDVRLMLLGSRRVLVENHRGILEVGEACVRLLTKRGCVRIEGRGLVLRDARPLSVAVEGDIFRLTMERPDHEFFS